MQIEAFGSSSAGNCYRVSDGTTTLLLDAGLSFKEIQRRLNFKVSQVDGMLLSHCHGDHSKAVKDLMKAGIDCYMSEDAAAALGISGHRAKIVGLQQFSIGTWTIKAFLLEHDVTNYGYLLANQQGEKLVYITDSYYCRYKFAGLTHILLECNYSMDILQRNVDAGYIPAALKNRLLQSHMSLETAKEFLRANDLSRVQMIMLCHLSDGNSDAARFKREVAELTGKHVIIAGS